MYFSMPVKLYLENNAVANHADAFRSMGTRALIVTGAHSSRLNGSLDDICTALNSVGIPYDIFDHVEENPSVETVLSAADFGKAFHADMVIGVGGGSAIDAAKAVSLMLKNPDAGRSLLYSHETTEYYPVAAIPTTCGTGSEATAVSVLTHHDKETKGSIPHKLFPALSLVDGKYLLNAPISLTRNTALDAFSHLTESYLNSKANNLSRMLALEGLKVWSGCVTALETGKIDLSICNRLMEASTIAGMAISVTGTSIPHALSYKVTYRLNIPHGKAAGIFLSGFIREAPADESRVILSASGFNTIEAFDDFFQKVCGSCCIPDCVLSESIQSVLSSPQKMSSASYPLTPEILHRIAASGSRS